MLEQIEENPEIPVKAVQEQFQRRFSVGISRMKAYRAKFIAKKHVEGDYAKQYTLLRDYANELIQQNPGTTVKIEVDANPDPGNNTRQFRRIYVCLAALKQGLKAIGRDFLVLDGAFMKGPFPGQLLSAVGVDCNNGIYPVAYAIVESENKESWTWFLEILGDDLGLGTYSNFTFISDRQKGILPAISKLFPCAEHRYCLRHIHENMKVSFKGDLYKDKLWNCACATTVPELSVAMDDLKAFNKKAHLWLSKIPPLHWSRAYFSGRAVSDIVLNSMCEVFNGKIVEGRDKPIISALEYIREYLMRRIVTVLNVMERSEGLLTPKATEVFEGIKRDATAYHVQWNGGGIYIRHAVAAIWEKAANRGRVGALESWVHPVYTVERWKQVYSFRVNPINGRTLWTRVHAPTTITLPKHHTQVGRPKKLRKRSAVELKEMTQSGRLSKKHTKGACSKCKKTGHNSRTCKGQGEAVKTGKSGKSGKAEKKRKVMVSLLYGLFLVT
ncbi:uncharacterized protein LOC110888730 [Helianthus annuus]|uniref:uncharacterized protein LOC110888730 n=1 Tax=Helianthus annuus TaxID=4232 RepID=UPI000B8F9B60|nr:uncharacterized protein LOC110888730 [Helianthus annuus]